MVNGTAYDVLVDEIGVGSVSAPAPVITQSPAPAAPVAAPAPAAVAPTPAPAPAPAANNAKAGSVVIKAPMPGSIIKVCVTPGASIKKDQVICVLEAMKMENEIFAPQAGTVATIDVSAGTTVSTGDVLITLS